MPLKLNNLASAAAFVMLLASPAAAEQSEDALAEAAASLGWEADADDDSALTDVGFIAGSRGASALADFTPPAASGLSGPLGGGTLPDIAGELEAPQPVAVPEEKSTPSVTSGVW